MKVSTKFSICLAILLVATRIIGAPITWVGPTTISGNSDVNTDGRSVFAYTGGTAATVNGVVFTKTLAASLNNHYLQLAGLSSHNGGAFTTTSNNFAALSADYKKILVGAAFENAGAVTTNSLKNLIVGRIYTVQLWISDPRSGVANTRYAVLDGGFQIPYNNTQSEGGVGAFAVGTFTADASTQSFTLDGDVSTQLNAIQLRVDAVPLTQLYWDANADTAGFGTAGGTWGADANWSIDPLGSTLPDQPPATTFSNIVHFGTTGNGLAAGSINVTSTQSFDTLSFGIANTGPLAITNGTLAFTTPASTIILNALTNTISSTLAPGGSLAIRSVTSIYCNKFPTLTDAVLFTNAVLANYAGAGATMGGASISNGSTTPTAASVYFWTNDGTTITFQVQTFDDRYFKCVKVQLSQSGYNIVGKALWAKYITATGNNLGYNFETGGEDGTVATWFNTAGYGVAEITLDRTHRFGKFLTTTPQTIAANVTLASIENIESSIAGGSVDNDYLPASIYHFVKTGTNATFQAQLYDGGHTKCVKVELLPSGNNIQARTLYAKYLLWGDYRGYNFDTGGNNSDLVSTLTGGGYGIRTIGLNTSQPTLVLSADSPFNSLTTIQASTLKLEGRLGSGTMSGDIVNNGVLELAPANEQRLTGPISGTGSLVRNGQGTTITYNTLLTTTPVIIATNKTLSHYVAAAGVFGAGSMDGAPVTPSAFFFANNVTNATVQFQVFNGGHTKVAKVLFKQVGADITAEIAYIKHCSSPHGNNVGANYDNTGEAGVYNLIQVALVPNKVYLSGINTYMGGTVLNSGELEITTAASLPALGGIVVNNGNLLLNAPGLTHHLSSVGGLNNSITVFAGGTLTLAKQFNAGHSRPIILDGGTMNSTFNNAADGVNYVCNLTLKNGARVTGNSLRTGYGSEPTFRVQGSSPSSIEAGLYMVSGNWSLEVDNVTGDEAADLTISGNLHNMSGYGPQWTYKRNAGTVSLSGNNAAYTGPVFIEAGAITLDSDNALTAANSVTLAGGSLVSTTFNNSIGNITLNTGAIRMGTEKLTAGTATLAGNTEITLSTGTLVFANSSGTTWSTDKNLDLVGTFKSKSIRFGTTAGGLSPTQLSAITLNGKRTNFTLDAEGYLVRLVGTLIMVQ